MTNTEITLLVTGAITIVTLICTVSGAIIGYMTYRKRSYQDIGDDASQKALQTAKLDYISRGIDDIKLDMKSHDKSIKDLTIRIVKCEESTKSAHHRIDRLKGVDINE